VTDRILELLRIHIESELARRKSVLALPSPGGSLAQHVGNVVCAMLEQKCEDDGRVAIMKLPWFKPFCRELGITKGESQRLIERIETLGVVQNGVQDALVRILARSAQHLPLSE